MNAIPTSPRTNYDQLFIDGRWTAPGDGVEAIINPATEESIGEAPVGTVADARLALAAARRSFDDGRWADEHRQVRADAIRHIFERMHQTRETALALMRLEMGFTRMQGEFQFALAATQVERLIALAAKDPMKSLPIMMTPRGDGTTALGGAVMTRDPIGVVSAITPYNAGYLLGLLKALPAIAAGNSVVLKPSPFTPLQTMFITEMLAELDLPPGVFNMVTGGVEVGQTMASDPRVDMVSFTGSDAVGAQIMAQAAPTLKKVHLELGGKSPLIIRHDADIQQAVMAGIFGFVHQAGQGCSMTTRMLVDNRIRPAFVEALAAATAQCKVGNPAEPDIAMGPLIRRAAVARCENFCERALAEGARLVTGGKRPAHLGKGYYFEPTIFDDVRNDGHLGQREVFGPIAAVIGFDSDAEAIRLANQSDYGLGGAIISRDTGRAMQMALKIRTGMVTINNGPGGFHPDMPFGGYKKSGIGREWGEEGFNEYTEIKSISFPAG